LKERHNTQRALLMFSPQQNFPSKKEHARRDATEEDDTHSFVSKHARKTHKTER